jgi:hypothetical protein
MTIIQETAVTGIEGKRTPRTEIEAPVTNRKREPIWIGDASGSNLEEAGPESPTTKVELITATMPLIVAQLAEDDTAYTASVTAGQAEEQGGGVLSWLFSEPGEITFAPGDDEPEDDPRFLGDVNPANVAEKLRQFRNMVEQRGRTYVMPVIRAAETAYLREFPDDSSRAMEVLITTDGLLSDPDDFETWLEGANEGRVCAVCVYGYGQGHDAAVAHYRKLAQGNPYLTFAALTGVTDPMEVAFDLRLLAGTAAK